MALDFCNLILPHSKLIFYIYKIFFYSKSDAYAFLINKCIYKNITSRALARLIKNAYGRLYNQKRRHPDRADDVTKLIRALQIEADNKKLEVIKNRMTKKDFET
ncbi:hypothetical protein RF007C_05290 [Ruminococcus flavefaciens 007c]|uniref:Uncharacterized protein n=1 Tax=Ruminococcus flavefaciens 007c TaxID=1341157 RepID=W7V2N3_RUMFL|nr:hypothetical protein RF007C_05290 [Ruminococcus flavefaciens 007c]